MQLSHKIEDISKRMEASIIKDDLIRRLNEFEQKLNEASKVVAQRSLLMFEHHGKLISLQNDQKKIREELRASSNKQ